MSRFRFIHAEKANYPVALQCRVLAVSRAGYYAWARRGPSARTQADVALSEPIVQIHTTSRATYGVPRVPAELLADQRFPTSQAARLAIFNWIEVF